MAYGPPVVKQCVHCKTEYKCLNHMANKSRFCSVDCHNLNQSFIKTEYTCAHCNDKFMARPDHGAPRKFCSRNVFWQTVFSLLKKSVRTAAAYLQLLGRVPPLGVMVEGFIALKNVMWKARAGSKKNHVLPAGSFLPSK